MAQTLRLRSRTSCRPWRMIFSPAYRIPCPCRFGWPNPANASGKLTDKLLVGAGDRDRRRFGVWIVRPSESSASRGEKNRSAARGRSYLPPWRCSRPPPISRPFWKPWRLPRPCSRFTRRPSRVGAAEAFLSLPLDPPAGCTLTKILNIVSERCESLPLGPRS